MNAAPIDFQADVLDRSRRTPVLVDFWAEWCGPCKMLGPVLEKLAAEAAGRWVLVKIDTEAQPELAARFQIRGIPNVKLFHHGRVVAEFAGALPEFQVRQWLEQNLPTPKRDAMARARELLRAGHAAKAAALLRPLAAAAPSDDELAVLTARAEVFAAPAAALARIEHLPPGSPWQDEAAIVRTLAAAFQRETAPAASADQRSRYLTALAQLRRESFDAGLAALLDLLLEKPLFDEGRAKAVAAAVFRHLGPRHPLAEKHWRTFSMAVNA
jgi:putative thioredoxin